MKKTLVSILMVSGILLFANCHPKMHKATEGTAVTPKPAETPAPAVTAEQIAQGKVMFESECKNCHDLPKAEEHTVKSWNKILPDMYHKANTSFDHAKLISAYVLANAKK